ncbi:hypothetical protein CKO28_15485 [Rhodovibrio sodomensis]|uniref:Recombinase family protein n=1 Tax=Rhodovibrio sodomensis TaxID=1088 RepID=A0ABS1DJ78_9PROT|nr:recombinase family protein [Rhodovibrio sodomensis]MBK1669440.1 hypothetical protein [Rhodovibrio sodomensis]
MDQPAPTAAAKTKAYSYLRFSTPDQMRGDSHRRQTELARQYAVRHGLDLDDNLTFNDLGVSAFRGRNAKAGALRAFLDAVEYEYVSEGSYLLVESLDRLSRDEILSAQALFMQIVGAGINLVTLQDRRCYSKATINANPTDLIVSIVTMMRAHEESATKQRRLKAVWKNKRDRATDRPMTEKAPAWLRLDREAGVFEVIPERAEMVRRIYSMAEAGVGYERIARTLNEEGVATFGRSEAWQRSYVVKLLSNEAVIGTFVPHVTEYLEGHKVRRPQTPITDYYPAIIDRETFERMRAQRSEARAPSVRGTGTLRNLLGHAQR